MEGPQPTIPQEKGDHDRNSPVLNADLRRFKEIVWNLAQPHRRDGRGIVTDVEVHRVSGWTRERFEKVRDMALEEGQPIYRPRPGHLAYTW